MSAQSLLQRLLKGREFRVEMAPGKWVILRRPAESEMRRLLVQTSADQFTVRVTMPDLVAATVGWDGVTEDDVLGGGGVGSDDPAEFSRELWEAFIADRSETFALVSGRLAEAITKHLESKAQAEKN